jgi:hypothetical protein
MPTRTKKHRPPVRWRVAVVELPDDLPRRHPDRERLKVSITVKSPEQFENLRTDLGPKRVFTQREDAKMALEATIARLRRRGYTVNGNLEVYTLYVIELDSAKAPNHRGYLYVGSTGIERTERVKQHRDGHWRNGKPVHGRSAHRHFVRHRPDLEPDRVYFSREDALVAESRLRRRWEARGYRVEGGTERLGDVPPIERRVRTATRAKNPETSSDQGK